MEQDTQREYQISVSYLEVRNLFTDIFINNYFDRFIMKP